MKMASSLRVITSAFVFSAVLITGAFTAKAADPSTSTEPTTFGRCVFPSIGAVKKIVQLMVVNDLKAKNLTSPNANATITGKTIRSTVKQSNITGLTSVTQNADGSYKVNTSAPLSAACAMELSFKISGAYKDSTGARKTFAGAPQTVVVSGAFN